MARKVTTNDKKRKKYMNLANQSYKRRRSAQDKMFKASITARDLIQHDKGHTKSYKNAIARYRKYANIVNKEATIHKKYRDLYLRVPEN